MSIDARHAAIVTGATGGLGRQICLQLAERGWDLVLGWHQSESTAQSLMAELASLKTGIHASRLDMGNTDSLAAAIDFEFSSPIDTLIINAAARPQIAPFGRLDLTELEAQFQVSVLGPFEMIRSVWRRHFQRQRKGHLIVISTIGVEPPSASRMAGYIVGKAALEAVASCAMSEYGSAGLATTIVRLSYSDTPFLQVFEPRFVDMLREKGLVSSAQQAASVITHVANNPPASGNCVICKS
ncbi:MAG: SDR family oxidoreductase [Rhizomicrobium sp.]